MDAYPPPTDALLTLGDPRTRKPIASYVADCGIASCHVPDLLRMVADRALNRADPESDEVWAPLHAWRALGELRAEAAVGPLLSALEQAACDDDDWAMEELPEILGKIGPACITAVERFFNDDTHNVWARVAAVRALEETAKAHPAAREECVRALLARLERLPAVPTEDDVYVLTFCMNGLAVLKAVEALEPIRRAFEKGCIDESVRGEWEEVRAEMLGEPPPARTRPRRYTWEALGLESPSNEMSPPSMHYRDLQRREKRRLKNKKRKARQRR